ncbi:MAG: hypothetical protein EBR01_13045, partial [Proteobacteria bacterium]|nr:hypothetical protein [Pseudomonadota bacterium]
IPASAPAGTSSPWPIVFPFPAPPGTPAGAPESPAGRSNPPIPPTAVPIHEFLFFSSLIPPWAKNISRQCPRNIIPPFPGIFISYP